jgi:hypothetical protein
MAHYKDMTVCSYFDASAWLCRLIAVGWIEQSKPFEKGQSDGAIIERIHSLREDFNKAFPSLSFRGHHSCSICMIHQPSRALLDHSNVNLFVPHRGFVFVAPARIDHYIEIHQYLPPASFVASLFACPSPLSPAYREAIRASNRGVEAPIFVQTQIDASRL